MKAYRIRRNIQNHYLVDTINVGSKLHQSLSDNFQFFFNKEKQQYSDFEMYCTDTSLESLLNYFYDDLGKYIFTNKRYYKTKVGVTKYILSNL